MHTGTKYVIIIMVLIYSNTVRHGFDQVLPNANRAYLTVRSQTHRTAPHRWTLKMRTSAPHPTVGL